MATSSASQPLPRRGSYPPYGQISHRRPLLPVAGGVPRGVAGVRDRPRRRRPAVPGSERNPQFDADALAGALAEHGIEYVHAEALGGRRSGGRTDSPNDGWRNRSFRAYADYALTDEFRSALDRLSEYVRDHTPAITCAEAVYWRRHRCIVADWLVARGHDVVYVLGPDRADEHELTRFAAVRDGCVVYPGDGEE
ncbi:DUF488 domain-containing protein [Halorarum salinum]|uniref:DUF488 domain-containing protein n=1 Tax=Halorarum salinum TaxID=2743089 RepID=UPI001C52B7CD|nr:DUF488 domain-containing protein [Halobaculum salinum]